MQDFNGLVRNSIRESFAEFIQVQNSTETPFGNPYTFDKNNIT